MNLSATTRSMLRMVSPLLQEYLPEEQVILLIASAYPPTFISVLDALIS